MSLPDSLLATLNALPPDQIGPVLDAIQSRAPGAIQAHRLTKETGPENPFTRGRMRSDEFPDTLTPIERLWFGFYKGCLSYLCGETGAGKSSLLYAIMVHAALNEPLWNVLFGLHHPLKILYIDPENSGNFDSGQPGLCLQKLQRIGHGKPVNLHFHDGQGVNLSKPAHSAALEDFVGNERYDVVVLDPIINLFGTKDENDNAEAGAQFAALKQLAKTTNAAICAVHHTGRDGSGIFGRGATARLGASDVGMVLRVRGTQDEIDDDYGVGELMPRNDFVRLQMVKNRMEPGKASLFLRMAGDDRFERVIFDDWKNAAQAGKSPAAPGASDVSKLYQAKDEIQTLLADRRERDAKEIIEAMKSEGIGIVSAREALKELVEDKMITAKRNGRSVLYLFNDDGSPAKENEHHHKTSEPETKDWEDVSEPLCLQL